jgi:Domain of unknown function (DUF1906)
MPWLQQRTRGIGGAATIVAGLAFACQTTLTSPPQRSKVADMSAAVAQTAAAVTGQKATLANDYTKGHFVGFDTHTYPGTPVMKAWKETPGSPYKWVGYYLPAPCHDDTSWVGKRETLQKLGWGIAIVYVGQQTWGHTPRDLTSSQRDAIRKKTDCSVDLISAEEGKANADDATVRAEQEGFAKGSIVFLDLERMQTIPPQMRDYYRAWVARMLENGKYKPGIYTHQFNADQVFTDVKNVFTAAGDTSTPRFWIAGGKGFDTGRAPQDVGYAFAGVWQGVIDVARSVANIRLPVDVNVASWLSPSESGTATQ